MNYAICSFIDILGYTDMVIADCRNATQEYANKQLLREVLGRARKKIGNNKVIIFSDSIVSFFEFSQAGAQDAVDASSFIQSLLLTKGILCRGGIAHGRHEYEEGFLFSEALIESYRIESMRSVYPRVVISNETVELLALTNHGSSLSGVFRDFDKQLIVDYSSVAKSDIGLKFADDLIGRINTNISASVAMKWHWFIQYSGKHT